MIQRPLSKLPVKAHGMLVTGRVKTPGAPVNGYCASPEDHCVNSCFVYLFSLTLPTRGIREVSEQGRERQLGTEKTAEVFVSLPCAARFRESHRPLALSGHFLLYNPLSFPWLRSLKSPLSSDKPMPQFQSDSAGVPAVPSNSLCFTIAGSRGN